MWNRTDSDGNSHVESALDGHRQELRPIAGIEPVRNENTVGVASADRCILATVDMRGRPVGLQFFPGIEKLTYDEIAERVLTTIRYAAEQVSRLDE
jgi:hypothetical protein